MSVCKQSGHSRNNCEQYTTEKARRDYGSYASEILEGQQTTQEDAQTRHLFQDTRSPFQCVC
jgi:hypothetical protein